MEHPSARGTLSVVHFALMSDRKEKTMMKKLVLALALPFAGFSASALAADSNLAMTLAIETQAAPALRADLHAEKRARVQERLLLSEATTPLADGSKARFEGSGAYVSESEMPITMAIETKASPEQREGLHQNKREWAAERSVLLQPWVPDPSAPGGAGT
jgi:hypothetical protein